MNIDRLKIDDMDADSVSGWSQKFMAYWTMMNQWEACHGRPELLFGQAHNWWCEFQVKLSTRDE